MTLPLLALPLVVSLAQADPIVVIDPGHGGSDPGAVGNGLYESDLNLEAAQAFRDWLELDSSDGGGGGRWDVAMTRESDVYISLSGRCDYANSLGADWFMSIHTNAGGGDGTETYAYASGTTADDLAHNVQDEVLDHLGTRDRGVKYESFYVLVYTSMPADLNEMAFIDTWSGNAELLSDPANLDAVGLAHLHAIQRQSGIAAYTPGEDTDPGEPTGRVWFDDWPVQVDEGAPFTVTVGYQTDLHAFGQRGQLGLRMVDADQWGTLEEIVWDNGGTGIQGPEGDHSFELEAPSGVDEVLFVTWMSPLGAGWDDRYDDANTSATPTTIGSDDPGDTGEPPVDGEIELGAVPGFVVLGQPFELRVRVGEGVADQAGRLGVELIELQRGLVVETLLVDLEPGEEGSVPFGFTYSGQAEQIWFHTCAFESGQSMTAASCIAEDSSEAAPTRVMQGRERFIEGGCGCSSPSRNAGSWSVGLLALLGLALRRRRLAG
jgi:N-acetylmuramoyl-L-alanine amidase